MSEAAGRVVVVTGASSGIGAATAVELAGQGFRVALGARRQARLEALAKRIADEGGVAFAHPLDVSKPESIETFYQAAESELGAVEVLVNNAGLSILSRLHEARVEDLRYELEVNLLGPLWMSRRAIPGMLAQGSGDLVFVSSQNAVDARPYQAAYTAAKAGIEGLARVLAMELEGTGVRASVVRPGPTGSEFGAGYDGALMREVLEAWKYWGVQRNLHWMPAEAVARAIAKIVTTPLEESHVSLVEVMPGGRKKEIPQP